MGFPDEVQTKWAPVWTQFELCFTGVPDTRYETIPPPFKIYIIFFKFFLYKFGRFNFWRTNQERDVS